MFESLQAYLSTLPNQLVFFFAIALLISSAGFLRVVYFVSLGYAFSIAAIATVTGVLFFPKLTPLTSLHALFLLLYGLRLGIFLIRREQKPSYKKELAEVADRSKDMKLWTKWLIWISVAALYVLMASPLLVHLQATMKSSPVSPWFPMAGLLLMLLGLGLEGWADHQKSAFKKEHPHKFCNVGLYRYSRCPNYFGEMVFWVGNFTTVLVLHPAWWTFVAALIGLVCILLIMMGSAKRLEAKQRERYGEQEDFQTYSKTVPILFPFVPLYSLQNIRVYLE